MKSKDGVKLIPRCNCGRVKPWDEWIIPNKEAKKAIQDQEQRGYIKFIKSFCPNCLTLK